MSSNGAKVAIRLLQEAAERGDLDPWDVDVIAVIDGFLDQLQVRIQLPRLVAQGGGSYEQDLSESSEAFLAASVLVALKADVLKRSIVVTNATPDDSVDVEAEPWEEDDTRLALPPRAERFLSRRPVAPPPLLRKVTLGELIQQLETMEAQLEAGNGIKRRPKRTSPLSRRAAIAEVTALAHREKLPETTAALHRFLDQWSPEAGTGDFEGLVKAWARAAPPDLDTDRVGVFWALLFLCSQGRVNLHQCGGLHGPLHFEVCPSETGKDDGNKQTPTQPELPFLEAAANAPSAVVPFPRLPGARVPRGRVAGSSGSNEAAVAA